MTHPLYQHSQRPSLPGKDLDKNGGGVLLGDCVGRRGGREQGGGDGGWPIGIEKKMNSTNEVSATTGRPLRADRYLPFYSFQFLYLNLYTRGFPGFFPSNI